MAEGEHAAKIYTRTGDKGKTSLIGGKRVSKSDPRLDAYGTVDELNCVLGILQHDIAAELGSHAPAALQLNSILHHLQSELFDVGSQLACDDAEMRMKLPGVSIDRIKELEELMDRFSANLVPLKNFILPGGSRAAGFAHLARTVCRRAERLCVSRMESETDQVDIVIVQFLNRLSDFFFVLARYLNHLQKIDEPIWSAKKKS